MADTTAISALLSASAVVGAITTQQIVTWYVEAVQLRTDVSGRSADDKNNDNYTQELSARLTLSKAKQRALLWIAGIQWAVVTTLLALALCLANPWKDSVHGQTVWPFFVAACALVVALVVVPGLIACLASRSLRTAWNGIR